MRVVALAVAALAPSQAAHADERGSVGGALDAGVGRLGFVGDLRAGVSAWYRLKPALALGLNASRMFIDNGDSGGETVVARATMLEAFADGRLFPSSFVGGFGRLSAGIADLSISQNYRTTQRLRPVIDLELGPELRIFFAPPSSAARTTLFLRARGTFTAIPIDADVERASSAFFGFGLALGFEG